MFRMESYVTPILLSYVDKYVKDFKPADAQVSMWGGGVVLHNLVLKEDVLQQGVSLPFRLISGRIHELHIQVPWTKIMSEPIVVTIDTIECVLSLKPSTEDATPMDDEESHKQIVETPPGYMQALVRRIVSNIAVKVHHLILKYVDDDIVLSLNVKEMSVESVAPDWTPAFTDINQLDPILRRLVKLDDLTLCLDQTDSDGKIRLYQEPLLYRCQITFRLLTRLVNATTRRAQSLDIQIRSSKLAWGVTREQLSLLLRLIRERVPDESKTSMNKAASTSPKMGQPSAFPTSATVNQAEVIRRESWSDWAWSWFPSWSDREGGLEEIPPSADPVPLHVAAHLDSVSLIYKAMEVEHGNKKRAKSILELNAECFAIKSSICSPTLIHISVGMKHLKLQSQGKCVCGYTDTNTVVGEPTVYLYSSSNMNSADEWKWPDEDNLTDSANPQTTFYGSHQQNTQMVSDTSSEQGHSSEMQNDSENKINENICRNYMPFWQKLGPIFYLEYNHERAPSVLYTNPYDNPPTDFEYSDWREQCSVSLNVEPMEIRICLGLIHRVSSIINAFKNMSPIPKKEPSMRVLTVEECEALSENLPCRVINVELKNLRIGLHPGDHSSTESPVQTPLALYIDIPKTNFDILMALYPHRVCSAASQLQSEDTTLTRGSHWHLTSTMNAVQISVANPQSSQLYRPIARIDLEFVLHVLLYQNYFTKPNTILVSYSIMCKEINIGGSLARLQAAYQIFKSLISQQYSPLLKCSTLPHDALNDQDAAIIDLTSEGLNIKGFLGKIITTHIIILQTAKATILHAPGKGELKQTWLFSAPDIPTTSPFVRITTQFCKEAVVNALSYVEAWSEPMAVCIDPLFMAWLAYRPQQISGRDPPSGTMSKIVPSTSQMTRRRSTPPSFGRVPPSRSGSGSELVHTPRPRSQASGSGTKPSKVSAATASKETFWDSKNLIKLYTHLKNIMVNIEIGFIVVYISPNSASALDCATVRDAMERHTAAGNKVFVASLGRFSVHSNLVNKQFWSEVRYDGPTYLPTTHPKPETEDSFPWKIRFADVSCYTLHVHVSDRNIDKSRLQLKVPSVIAPKTVLDLLTTTVTLSVVTKCLTSRKDKGESMKQESLSEKKMKYFTQGADFKPATLKEFIRGPTQRNKDPQDDPNKVETSMKREGPLVSIGVCLHAETPPILIRLDQDQCDVVMMAMHNIGHLLSLFRQEPVQIVHSAGSSQGVSGRSVKRSISEMDETGHSNSDTHSEQSLFIPIFESPIEPGVKVKASFWFQWVTHRITLVTTSSRIMFTFNAEDIISTVDLQTTYNQYKIKITSASVKFHQWGYNEWTTGILGGRVLEKREPTASAEENQFLVVTVTQAQVASLPASWKEEMLPKLLEKSDTYSVWEIFAIVAPLEGLMTPTITRSAAVMLRNFKPLFVCPLPARASISSNRSSKWPYCYINFGGIRILWNVEEVDSQRDDTIVLSVNRINVNPRPENPIIRRATSTSNDGLTGSGGPEGRQYEMFVENVTVQSAQFSQLVNAELASYRMDGPAAENPALLWAQPPVPPVLTTILHPLQLSCIVAPPLYVGNTLTNVFALELNLISDCNIDVGVSQLGLFIKLMEEMDVIIKLGFNRASDSSEVQCAYAKIILSQENLIPKTSDQKSSITEETSNSATQGNESDFDSMTGSNNETGKSNRMKDVGYKKSASVGFIDETSDGSDNMEFYLTVGNVRMSLYILDNNNPMLTCLRPPPHQGSSSELSNIEPKRKKEKVKKRKSIDSLGGTMSSPDEMEVKAATSTTNLLQADIASSQSIEGILPLMTVLLQQPNMFYWKKRSQKSLQVSLFNAWVGLGSSPSQGGWNLVLFHTKKGQADPITEIPPELLSLKLLLPLTAGNLNAANLASRGNLNLDIQRPIMIEVSVDRIQRLKAINSVIQLNLGANILNRDTPPPKPPLFKIRKFMMDQGIENIKVQTQQIGAQGCEAIVGWDTCCVQINSTSRFDSLLVKGLMTALQVTTTAKEQNHRPLLHPLVLGIDAKISWEAWQRVECGNVAEEPITRLRIDFDRVTVDLVPHDLKALHRITDAMETVCMLMPSAKSMTSNRDLKSFGKTSMAVLQTQKKRTNFKFSLKRASQFPENSDHYYKDDLRSGAFKIVAGDQLPMAYQIMLQENIIAWRYPHPRAIIRFVAFPLPNQSEELQCVLEYYSSTLSRWESHTWFKLPVAETREVVLAITPPDAVFASMWRFRVCNKVEETPPFEFYSPHFSVGLDNAAPDQRKESSYGRTDTGVSSQALSGALCVDSYFAPKHLPRCKLAVQVASLDLHLHNTLPMLHGDENSAKGYYISKQQSLTNHRVLSLVTRDNVAHVHFGSSAGKLIMFQTRMSADIMESATGLMERFVDECRIQAAVALPDDIQNFRLRLCSTPFKMSLHLPRLQTLKTHANVWRTAISEFKNQYRETVTFENCTSTPANDAQQTINDVPVMLDGLIYLWVKNDCSFAIRLGQELTEEYTLLPTATMLAYRWRDPNAPRKLRFSLETDNTVVHWSESVSFQEEESRVHIIKNTETPSANPLLSNVYMHTRVEDQGGQLCMRLFGRVQLANMLRKTLAFKIKARHLDSSTWMQLSSGELSAESYDTTVICTNDCELILKIKFAQQNTSWSGEIPLKECLKENLPWLVKIPCEGNIRYTAVWCRVVHGRSDGRILAMIWPLYMLQSHMSLDIDVVMTTTTGSVDDQVPSLVQSAPGRGTCSHIMTPGTTTAKHNLVLRYRNLETPVMRDAIPLHYAMIDTSVFKKRVSVKKIDEVIAEIIQWLDRNKNGSSTKWPYSSIARHWPANWLPALFQPRSDINVTYSPVRIAGGCSLELQLRPAAMFCNAAPVTLTLRSHDGSPLFRIESGAVIAAPSVVLNKPFFMSVDVNYDMHMSIQLELWHGELGRYTALPPGRLALDCPAEIAIVCSQKVVMLTLLYELKEDINVFGVTCTYRLINKLGTRILVTGVVVSHVYTDSVMRPNSYEIIEPHATGPGTPLSKFWMGDGFDKSDINEIFVYLWIALPDDTGVFPAHLPVPILLKKDIMRNAFSLKHPGNRSIPIAVTQQLLDGCVVITVAEDPYPQFYIQNYTQMSLFVGEPLYVPPDNCSWNVNQILPECLGLEYYSRIEPSEATHYSTPTYYQRHPASDDKRQLLRKLPFLAFAKQQAQNLLWSPPVAITDGEQLVQVPCLRTIKMRVTIHPHSTLIELQNVNQSDISASDIRRRLQGTSSEPMLPLQRPVSADNVDKTLDLSKALNQIEESDLFLHYIFETTEGNEASTTMDAATATNDESELRMNIEQSSESLNDSDNATSSSIASYHIKSQSSSSADNLRLEDNSWQSEERARCVLEGVVLSMASTPHASPLFVAHVDRVALHMMSSQKGIVIKTSVGAVQVDNREYDSGQYDFAVVATTRRGASGVSPSQWPVLTNMFGDRRALPLCSGDEAAMLRLTCDNWTAGDVSFTELTEVVLSLSPLALYVEDAYVTALASLIDRLRVSNPAVAHNGDATSTINPIRLRLLHIHPMDLNLTLHTAVRMYIALDQSPLHLTEFKLHDLIITNGGLMHSLTVHYLSAAVLAAGWVVGGLELLGAPGALAARVGNATGGVRGVAYTVATALLRSVSAWAGSLARNLDLLAGDEEHARRAAANRRNPPQSLFSGLLFGLTNLAVNMLGAVGGIAHHPLLAAAEGETGNTAAGLRRGLVGAFTKPLSATADLLAFAGHGLLRQTGWDPLPQPLPWTDTTTNNEFGWQRECICWDFRLTELQTIAGYRVLLNDVPLLLLLTTKYLMIVDPDTEKIIEMVEFKNLVLPPYRGAIIELAIRSDHSNKNLNDNEENHQYQINLDAMTRVARYTGVLNSNETASADDRCVRLLPTRGEAHALYATLTALAHTNSSSHFSFF